MSTTASAGRARAGSPTTTTVVRPARSVVELTGDPGLGVGVDGARRLDEDEDLGVREQRPGEHEPLPLPAGERPARARRRSRRARREARRARPPRRRPRSRPGSRSSLARAHGSSSLAKRAREDQRIGLADEDPPPHDLERQPVERRVAEQHAAVASTRRPSRSASALVSSGAAETRHVRRPGSTTGRSRGRRAATPPAAPAADPAAPRPPARPRARAASCGPRRARA